MTPDTLSSRALSTEADAAVAQVHAWLSDAATTRQGVAAHLMEDMLRRPGGLAFLTTLLDGLMRPDDAHVAAEGFRSAARIAPRRLPWGLSPALHTGAFASRIAPAITVAAARRVVKAMVGHLVVDARPERLARALDHVRAGGADVNLNLLGEAVLGRGEAQRRVNRTLALIEHPAVDYVSIKVSAAVAPHPAWAFDEAVADVTDALAPLYRAALTHDGTFINLDMEEYRDLDLTLAVFEDLAMREEFLALPMGIVLQAYLPDSLAALRRLQDLARARAAASGAPLKVRIVKGANLSMERIEAETHGWRLATWDSKVEADAHYKRLLDIALDPASLSTLRVGLAGHNLFDIALTHVRCERRGITDGVDLEMLLGMAPGMATTVARTMGGVRSYTPAVAPEDFDVALAYLARRLEEVASPGNFLADVGELREDAGVFAAQERAFRLALEASATPPRRERGRIATPPVRDHHEFANAADADPAVPGQRDAGRRALVRVTQSTAGAATAAQARVADRASLDAVLDETVAAASSWGLSTPAERATMLRAVAVALEQHREVLYEVMASECGKTLEQSDPEISEAIDFARYYAMSAERLVDIDGARPVPRAVTLVTPPWNFPVAIPLGSTLAALAAGSAVVLKPAEEALRCGAVIREVLDAAGVPRDLVRLIDIDTERLGDALIGDPRVEQVILTGAFETAQRFLAVRPDLDLRAETSGKNALVVTPSADVDLAVRDLVQSAFGHAGQKCSAASLVILVGSAAASLRFRDQLIDAVTSLRVGPAGDPRTQMGPVILPPAGKLRRALSTLEEGEEWWVEQRELAPD
ncbi:MAG: proline dehydrogenase family protein, partial [Demequina sp.]|uniref:proline dehydrogenase family protein n=1 Tax=Demequina sp. TaxID=2050685 RepID=UPI003A8A0F5F